MTADQIIAADPERRAALEPHYDPLTGEGSPIPRVALRWREEGDLLHVPQAMTGDPAWGAWIERAAEKGVAEGEAGYSIEAMIARTDWAAASLDAPTWAQFCRARLRYDYEYFAAACCTIIDKDGEQVPLVLNAPQRASYAERYRLRQAGNPVRFLELKFRQYGSTTDKNAELAWLQNVVYPGHSAYVISLETGGAARIRSRYDLIAEKYPAWAGSISLGAVMGAPNSRRIAETGGLLSIASVSNPQGASGDTVQHALVSEAGKFPSTDVQSAERLFTNITSTVPPRPGTTVYIESTAEAVGVWFKDMWEKAEAGHVAYRAFFIGWLSDPQYQHDPLRVTLPDGTRPETLRAFVEAWCTSAPSHSGPFGYARLLWERGATLGQIAFYFFRLGELALSLPSFLQEMPSEAAEAFQYGSKRVFEAAHVAALRKTCREPRRRGRLVGLAPTGPDSLREIRFEDDPQGPLFVWHEPGDTHGGLLEAEEDGQPRRIRHRYAEATDVGAIAATSDPHCTGILDRGPRLFGGRSVIAAELHGRGPFYEWAWHSARLGMWYGLFSDKAAYWAIEENSIRRRLQEQEGPGAFEAFLAEIKAAHDARLLNLYLREVFDDLTKEIEWKIGFQTNAKSKGLIIGDLQRAMGAQYARLSGLPALDDEGLVERCLAACAEMDSYVVEGVTMEAAPKKKDDRVIVRALLAHLDRKMDAPAYVKPAERKAPRRGGMAVFS